MGERVLPVKRRHNKVVLRTDANGRGSVSIDGTEVCAIAVHIYAEGGGAPMVMIELAGCDLYCEVDGTVQAIAVNARHGSAERPVLPLMVPSTRTPQ